MPRPNGRGTAHREGWELAYAYSYALAYMSAGFSPVTVLMQKSLPLFRVRTGLGLLILPWVAPDKTEAVTFQGSGFFISRSSTGIRIACRRRGRRASPSPFIDHCQGDSNHYLRFKGRGYIPISNQILQCEDVLSSSRNQEIQPHIAVSPF